MSKEMYLIKDVATGKFINQPPQGDELPRLVDKSITLPELITKGRIQTVVQKFYGKSLKSEKYEVVEASASEYMRHNGRKGGRKRSAAKVLSSRRNAKLPRPNRRKRNEANENNQSEHDSGQTEEGRPEGEGGIVSGEQGAEAGTPNPTELHPEVATVG